VSSIALGSALLLALAAGNSFAEDGAAKSKQRSTSASRSIEEIVVTARRRDESAQDVPISLSVFGGDFIEKQNVHTIDQLQRLAPSLMVIGNNPRNTNINIRGLGANIGLSNDGLENGVGVYIDDVYYARNGQAMFDLVDLERIELLRGPQGTLFGKNTTGGAISIYTRKPDFTPELKVDTSLGNYGYRQIRASANGPIIGDRVAARISVANTSHDGHIKNSFLDRKINDYNNTSVKAQILANITDETTLHLSADYGEQEEDGYAPVAVSLVSQYQADGSLRPNSYLERAGRFPDYQRLSFAPFDRKAELNRLAQVDMTEGGGSVKLETQLGSNTLTSITAYRFWDWAPRNDADGVTLDVLTAAQAVSEQKQFTQETRLASPGGETVDYVVGLFFFDQQLDSDSLTAYGTDAPTFLLGAATDPAVENLRQTALNGYALTSESKLKLKSYAAFGQATWNINDDLSLTSGLRYTDESKRGTFDQIVARGADISGLSGADQAFVQGVRGGFGGANYYPAKTNESEVSGSLNLAYELGEDSLVYATYARGFKSGGITLTNVGPEIPKVIHPESIDHFEVGLKYSAPSGRWSLNTAAFRTTVDDYQASLFDPDRITTYVSNAGEVRSQGIEVEGTFNPLDGLSTYASVTYLDAEYSSFKNAPCAIEYFPQQSCDLSGEPLSGTPEWSVSTGAEYRHNVGENSEFYVGIDYSYRSEIFTLANNAPSSLIAGYGLVNARFGVLFGDSLELSLWSKNLFDKDYLTTVMAAGFNTGLITGFVGEPRTVGLTARWSYH